jgi:hypothetical protein
VAGRPRVRPRIRAPPAPRDSSPGRGPTTSGRPTVRGPTAASTRSRSACRPSSPASTPPRPSPSSSTRRSRAASRR